MSKYLFTSLPLERMCSPSQNSNLGSVKKEEKTIETVLVLYFSVESSCEHLQQISQSILLELLWYIVNQGQQPSSSKPHFSKAALELALSNRGSCVQVFSTLVLHLNKVKLVSDTPKKKK